MHRFLEGRRKQRQGKQAIVAVAAQASPVQHRAHATRKRDAPSPKTVVQLEAEMAKARMHRDGLWCQGQGRIQRVKRNPDRGAKQPIKTKVEVCQATINSRFQ